MYRRKPVLVGVLAMVALASAACSSTAPGGSTASSTASATGPASATGTASTSAAQSAAAALGINLSKCTTDPTAPLGASVNVGETLALTGGPATAYIPVGQGVKAAFDEFNATSGLSTKFNLIQADDQFNPAMALTAIQQLIEQDHVVAMTSTIGTAEVAAVRPLLNEACVPMLAGLAGGAESDDPSVYPWTLTYSLPSAVDARIWAESIAQKYPSGAKVAMFYSDDQSGQDFYSAVQHYLAGTKSKIVSTQTIEDTDSAAPASQVTSMRSSGANVLVAAPTGAACVTLLDEVAAQGWTPTTYMSSTCPTFLFDLAGKAANGVYLDQYILDPTRPPYNTNPAVEAAAAAIKKYIPGATISNTSIAGYAYAEPFLAAVKAAAASPLGLSRLGLLEAATHLAFQPALTLPGVTYSLNYPNQAVAMEAAELTQYNASSKTFTYIKLYNFRGQMTGIASTK
jgi:branched-chain amino acid transport system substrate-binding protein